MSVDRKEIISHIRFEYDKFMLNVLTYAEDNDIAPEKMASALQAFGIESDSYYDAVKAWNE